MTANIIPGGAPAADFGYVLLATGGLVWATAIWSAVTIGRNVKIPKGLGVSLFAIVATSFLLVGLTEAMAFVTDLFFGLTSYPASVAHTGHFFTWWVLNPARYVPAKYGVAAEDCFVGLIIMFPAMMAILYYLIPFLILKALQYWIYVGLFFALCGLAAAKL